MVCDWHKSSPDCPDLPGVFPIYGSCHKSVAIVPLTKAIVEHGVGKVVVVSCPPGTINIMDGPNFITSKPKNWNWKPTGGAVSLAKIASKITGVLHGTAK